MRTFDDMLFTFLLFGTWFVIALFWARQPRLPKDVTLFVVMLMSMIETILFTIATMTLRLVSFPEQPEMFVNHLLLRNVLRPTMYLFAVSAWFLSDARWKRWSGCAAVVLGRMLLTWTVERLGILKFEKIGYGHLVLGDIALVALSVLAACAFVRYTRGERGALA
ncbi:hypothetical protein [Paenibacillus sp.]|uniref:hypothetical protein n=1 Tax=Paenibacillus sp. TaxID=58172 RepID=UPI002D32C185|nr:hypothetical protein [Paenibacillus sp.]HZG56749.1 hypothetical protein [Paenibacillus sp.]